MTDGFQTAMLVCAALAVAGGALAWLTISDDALAGEPAVATDYSCAIAGPPLRPATVSASSSSID